MGYTDYVGPELEFFFPKGANNPEPLNNGGYFDQLSSQPAADLRRQTVLNLADMEAQFNTLTTRQPTASTR